MSVKLLSVSRSVKLLWGMECYEWYFQKYIPVSEQYYTQNVEKIAKERSVFFDFIRSKKETEHFFTLTHKRIQGYPRLLINIMFQTDKHNIFNLAKAFFHLDVF